MKEKLPSTKILGISVTIASKREILDFIITGLKSKEKKFYIVTPNPEMLVYASTSSSFRDTLNHAHLSLPDGIGILAAGNILKKDIKERITGVDLMTDIVAMCAKEALSIGLLGGGRGVAEKTAECLLKKHPHLRVTFVGEEWDQSKVKSTRSVSLGQEEQKEKKSLETKDIDILFVAFGFPKQEEWIAKNLESLPVTCAMGVGGAFDFISGKVRRAPKFVRNIGMEWLFRLMLQPWRIRRQMALPKFVYLVLKEKFS
jgi:N-acetylglucosaminyldiphosphoundecaprenol N-acetyl-beta-D-mannosaminyltransferase